MSLLLAFDTETTGLVRDREPPSSPNQPHLVQLACVLVDRRTWVEHASVALVVRPDGYEVPAAAADVHGITTEVATRVGVPLLLALACFSNLARLATAQVGHNVAFDVRALQAAFHRAGRPFPPLDPRCTKELATPLLDLPPTPKMVAAGLLRPKPPTLAECFEHLFGEELVGAHDALADARGCLRVFREVEERAARSRQGVAS